MDEEAFNEDIYHVIMLLRVGSLLNALAEKREARGKATFKQPENEQFPG